MSLSKTLEQIKSLKPLLEEDISEGPRETYAGREGRQRNARDQYKSLKKQYTEELRLSSTFILVLGSAKEDFKDIAKSEFSCFSSNPEAFYEDLANRISPELYSHKTSAANLFDIMGRYLEDKAGELDIVGYPQLIMRGHYFRTLKGKEDFVALVKEAVNEQVGSEIVGINAISLLTEEAIEANHDSKLTPIVMTTDDESFALDLNNTLSRIGSRSFVVVAGKGSKTIKATNGVFIVKEVNSENVKNVLTNIANLCKTR